MNNSKPETTVAPNKQPEVSNVAVKDASSAANQPKTVTEDDKTPTGEAKQAAPTADVSKR